MLSDQEILELAERAGQGEREALGRLAGTLRPLICRWALVMTGDPNDAEDVAQLVLMKMMTSMEGFDGRSKVTSWVYRITRNASLDHQRRKKQDQRLAEKAEWSARAETPRPDDPLDDIEMKRTLRLIRTLLRELPIEATGSLRPGGSARTGAEGGRRAAGDESEYAAGTPAPRQAENAQ